MSDRNEGDGERDAFLAGIALGMLGSIVDDWWGEGGCP